MQTSDVMKSRTLAVLVVGAALTGCGDSLMEPREEPLEEPLNPALVEAVNADLAGDGLPQGSAHFTGPGGILMDATVHELSHEVTFRDGRTLTTAVTGLWAVPDESVTDRPFYSMDAHVRNWFSPDVPPAGNYTLTEDIPDIPWGQVNQVRLARIFEAKGDSAVFGSGTLIVETKEYSPDVYSCGPQFLASEHYEVIDCEYQLGIVRGVVEFTAQTGVGPLVQQRQSFELPARNLKVKQVAKSQGE